MSSNVKKCIAPSVPVTIEVSDDGVVSQRSYKLVFDFNALALVEEKTGFSLLTGVIFAHLRASYILALFWAALQLYQPEFRGEEGYTLAGSMMTLRNGDVISAAVQEAYIINLPDDQQVKIRAVTAAALEATRLKAEGKSVVVPEPPLVPAATTT